MMADPLISIILPTYNGSRYLNQSIQSCVSQSYSNWELIVVDDASSDDTPSIINQWVAQDSRIRYVRHSTNRKLPGALNTGFSLAQGEYFTWTSDDNEYLPSALDEMLDFLISHPEVDLVYTDFMEIDQAGDPLKLVEVYSPQDLVLKGNVVRASFLYKRDVHEKLGGYAEDKFLVEDYDFWIRAATYFRIEPLHKVCYLYRLHGSSLTSVQSTRIALAIAQLVRQNLPQINWLSQEMLAVVCFDLGMLLFEAGQLPEARTWMEDAFLKYQILISDQEYALNKFLYHLGELRPAQTISQLLELVPDRDPATRAFNKQVWGQYHGINCFESYRVHKRSMVRYHFSRALRYDLRWLYNRGLMRIVIWAYIGYNSQ